MNHLNKASFTLLLVLFFTIGNSCIAQRAIDNRVRTEKEKEREQEREKERERKGKGDEREINQYMLEEMEREGEKGEEAEEADRIVDYSFEDDLLRQRNHLPFPYNNSYATAAAARSTSSLSSAFSTISFLGPKNCAGRTRAILVDNTDPNLIFAGQTTGGLWRSTDKGLNWTPLNDQTLGMNITCIAQSPYDHNIIYYGTGEYKNSKIRSDGSGVYKSTDNGLTFSQLPSTNDPSFELVYCIRHSMTDANTLFVSTAENGLYKSTDAGATFQTVFNNGRAVSDIECFADGKVMITSSYDGIYSSPTGDAGTFTKSTVGLPTTDFSRIEMAYCDSFPNIMYSVFSDSVQSYSSGITGVYRSTDGGITWAATSLNPVNIGYYCFGDQILSIVIKPDDPDYVFCMGAQGAFTLNGGVSWTHVPYLKTDHHALVYDKFNNNILFVGNDQGIYSFDVSVLPLAVVKLFENYNTAQLWAGAYFPSGDNCLIGAQDNFFMKNSNNNPYFSHINNYGIDGNYLHVKQEDPTVSYISRNDAVILRSDATQDSIPVYNYILNELDTNGNEIVDDDTWHINPVEMNYLDGTQVYIPTRDRIWRTINSGNNWTHLTNSFTSSSKKPFAVGLSNAVQPMIYAGGVKGFFSRIDNAYTATPGQEVDLSASVPLALTPISCKMTCLAVLPSDNSTLYATIAYNDSVPKIWKITNGTSANPVWTDISGNFDNNLNAYWIEFDPLHPDSVLFVGTDYGLYSTTDAGTTWFRETDIPLVTIWQMRLRRSDRKLFVFTFGRGVWLAQLAGGGLGVDSPSLNNSITIFPNPSHGSFTASVIDKNIYIHSIDVTDIRGRVVKKLTYEDSFRIQTVNFDINEYASGIYFANIKTSGGVIRKKLTKL